MSIKGNYVGTTTPRTDWLQNNEKKADFLKNKPTKVSAFENDKGYLTQHQDISGKLDKSELPTAINIALAQAKESGAFDGEDGYSPTITVSQGKETDGRNNVTISVVNEVDGEIVIEEAKIVDGKNGTNGVSATHSWDGTTLTVTSASGTSSANLKGDKGDKGDSIKGDKGDKGDTGSAGASVTVTNVTTSTADGGSNVVTFSDGKTLTVKNGSKGSIGKTAYQYAKDGGYSGTETEFSKMLASGNSAPDYIVAEAEKVVNAVQAVRTPRTLVFSAMSDMHIKDGSTETAHINSLTSLKSAGLGLKEIQKRIDLDFLALLGDSSYMSSNSYTAEQTKKDILLTKKTLDLNKDKEIWCVGNHDLCYGNGVDRMLTEDEVYSYVGANSEGIKPYDSIERCYGYLDFDNQKIRVIYLNTNDCKDGIDNGAVTKDITSYMEMISPSQMRWLADVALDFTDKENSAEWGVVILSHQPIDYALGWYKQTLQILEAYRDRAKLENVWVNDYIVKDFYGEGQHKYVQHAENFDFTNVENPAEIICNIYGHMHNCAYAKTSSADTVTPWLWRICVPNMCDGRYNEKWTTKWGEVDDVGNRVQWVKELGTAKETSFNVMSIDRKSKKIYAHIFGAGKDRVFSYAEEYVPQTFAITTNLVNCVGASGNATTIVEDGTVTLAFTANDGYKLPEIVTVTGANYTWDATAGTLVLNVPTSDVDISVTATSLNLFNVSRTYQATASSSSFLENTDTREFDCTKYYGIDKQGRRGTYCDSKLKSHSMLEDSNGIVFQVTSTSGYGLEFPVHISGGKTYELKIRSTANTPDIWLAQYNNDTTFVKITKIQSATTVGGEVHTRTLTTEAGYLYSIAFTMAVKDADISAVNISLMET